MQTGVEWCFCFVCAVTVGHETVMGKATFFTGALPVNGEFDFEAEYPFLEELPDRKTQVTVNTL